MKVSTLVLALMLSVRAVAQAEAPKPPTQFCVDMQCTSTPAPSTDGVKWHPGHYMLVFEGDSVDVVLKSRIPEICREPALQGLQYRIRWHELETSKNVYSFREVDDIYAALKACNKRLVLQVLAVDFSSTDGTGIVPDYMLNNPEYNGGVVQTTAGYKAKLWESAVMDRLVAVYDALGRRYDAMPNFEGVIVAETAFGGLPEGYTATAWIEQLKRAIPTIVSAWPKTNVIVFNNFIQASTTEQFVDFVSFLHSSRVSIGGPDVLPPPHAGSKGERIYRGEIDGLDRRGKMPAAFAVQTPELGGKEGSFTPQQLYDMCVKTNQCGHIFWIRNNYMGGAAQQWDTGILPFIRQNPRTVDSCPSRYTSCIR